MSRVGEHYHPMYHNNQIDQEKKIEQERALIFQQLREAILSNLRNELSDERKKGYYQQLETLGNEEVRERKERLRLYNEMHSKGLKAQMMMALGLSVVMGGFLLKESDFFSHYPYLVLSIQTGLFGLGALCLVSSVCSG